MADIELDESQQRAVTAACTMENRVVAVTGAAGTGKTTIEREVFAHIRDAGYTLGVCAPTGKAAKRIYEAAGIDGLTIHRLLEFSHPGDPDPKTGKPLGMSIPKRDRQNPLECDVVIADEYAMVNNDIHRALFDAIKPGGVIRVFGDDNQLAPIEEDKRLEGKPSAFLQLLNNEKFPSVRLERVYRQGEGSGILFNANQLLRGKLPTRNEQWSQTITDKAVDSLRAYIEEQHFEHDISFGDIDNQVIVPQNTSWIGTRKLNPLIQGLFHNKADPSLEIPRHYWAKSKDEDEAKPIRMYVGDKVLQTRNNYDLGIFNGEIGKVIEIDDDSGEITIDFGDREMTIPPVQAYINSHGKESTMDPRKDLDLAYAVTTHKMQGSQCKRLVYILNKSNSYMINRRNFYTAATRAEEHVHVIADQIGLQRAVYKKD